MLRDAKCGEQAEQTILYVMYFLRIDARCTVDLFKPMPDLCSAFYELIAEVANLVCAAQCNGNTQALASSATPPESRYIRPSSRNANLRKSFTA